jgi:DNA-binding NarL/FixJ family response regulator
MSEFRIAVATSRPTVQAFFAAMGRDGSASVVITALPLGSVAVAEAADVWATASVAVVDAVEPSEAVAVCRELRARRPDLPILALFCCPQSATAAHLRAFLAEGVGGFVDLQLSSEETLRALRCVARGNGVFHVQLPDGSSRALSELFNGDGEQELSELDIGLLKLLALGQTDHEIGRSMFLSRHTVKHRIERLRRRAGARNRVQLAAWAARQDALRTMLLAVVLTAFGAAAGQVPDMAAIPLPGTAAGMPSVT